MNSKYAVRILTVLLMLLVFGCSDNAELVQPSADSSDKMSAHLEAMRNLTINNDTRIASTNNEYIYSSGSSAIYQAEEWVALSSGTTVGSLDYIEGYGGGIGAYLAGYYNINFTDGADISFGGLSNVEYATMSGTWHVAQPGDYTTIISDVRFVRIHDGYANILMVSQGKYHVMNPRNWPLATFKSVSSGTKLKRTELLTSPETATLNTVMYPDEYISDVPAGGDYQLDLNSHAIMTKISSNTGRTTSALNVGNRAYSSDLITDPPVVNTISAGPVSDAMLITKDGDLDIQSDDQYMVSLLPGDGDPHTDFIIALCIINPPACAIAVVVVLVCAAAAY